MSNAKPFHASFRAGTDTLAVTRLACTADRPIMLNSRMVGAIWLSATEAETLGNALLHASRSSLQDQSAAA